MYNKLKNIFAGPYCLVEGRWLMTQKEVFNLNKNSIKNNNNNNRGKWKIRERVLYGIAAANE